MEADTPVLSASDLSIGRGARTLVSGVDLDLFPGEIVAVLGPNGVGKSTLLASLAGLIEPRAGRIQTRARVALLLQNAPLARRSVLANVELALAWWGVDRRHRRDRALDALKRLHAGHLADRAAQSLSGGEARRVQLARVLALEAEVLMLDEPLAGLDPLIRSELLADLATTLPERGAATMVVLHERAEAWALADRLLILIDGRLVAAGPPAEVLERPPTPEVAAFLGFDGELREPDGSILRLRPAHVIVDPDGVRRGVVTRRIPEEDVVRLQLRLTEGSVHALAAYPGPALGETVALRIEGGVRFGGRREVGRALLA